MNTTTLTRITALALATTVLSVSAAENNTVKTHPARIHAAGKVPSSATAAALTSIDEAYALLEQADHDYKGHRADAMKHLERAAGEVGHKLRGDGRGHEKQGTSDSQLQSALSLLQGAVGGVTGRAHTHVSNAIKQLNIALSVK